MGRPASMDWEWATRTGGTLSPRQRRQLLGPLLRLSASHTAGRLRVALGLRGSGGIDLEALRWPDSQLAKDAEAEAREVLSPHVLQHSCRTYVFGLVLAHLDGAAVDEELGFVSSILHDLHLEHPTPGRCFAVVGGERAERFAAEHGAAPERAALVGAAIAGHITAGANEDLADPAGFVSAGALMDVVGARVHQTDPAFMAEVLRRHPRLGFKRALGTCWPAEAAAVPGGRAAWLHRRGFGPLVRIAPFDE
ncbi:phosphohydrolase [Patulibacter minatonensis]|uniref:phosphohydrolase n=1 Tax=Patulibacter minatonensis TaxID=298163 RepID=UPI00047C49A0|nr:phosphohydrolase [Patulibacter minatonensis]